jgi:outer membrane protein
MVGFAAIFRASRSLKNRMIYRYTNTISAVILLLCALSPTQAAQEVSRIPIIDAPDGTAGLGGGFRMGRDPYISGPDAESEVPLDLIPLYLYEGKWLFAHGTSGGVHFFKNENFSISGVVQYRFQHLNPSNDPIFEGLEKREQSVDAGIMMRYGGNWGELNLQGVTDTLDRHNGKEAQLSYRYTFKRGAWMFSPFVQWGWQDSNLGNYYFGVSEAEATPERAAYEVGDTQYLTLGVNTSWQLSDRVLLFGNFGLGGADKSIVDSPLTDNASFTGAFVGGTYMFGNVLKPVAGEDRNTEWSWRVNYGYQADGNIVGEIDHGDFSRSTHADTNIAGLTFGRLLTDGKRVDFLGKFAFYRHLEEGVTTENGLFTSDSDFWSYNAYIMVMGKGYSKWSGDEWFRYGFGFGMSYAEQVPLAEQSKQYEKGGNTSQFLNYLEIQVDFPLRRLFKAKAMKNCYAGVTIVHRSGIFGTSNILGDVSGGADWITAHLECVR